MFPTYRDLLELAKSCGKEPLWWDDNGTPRFHEFHPYLIPCIYADEALLMIIECQSCGRKFPVSQYWDKGGFIMQYIRSGKDIEEIVQSIDESKLSYQITHDHIPYYGDAPWHTVDKKQCAGTTMTTETLLVKEFWIKEDFDWVRKPEYEISFL